MPTIKQSLLEAFDGQKRALTIDELSSLTKIPIPKIRNRLSTLEYDIVRVSKNKYDLAEKVYKGKKFRYTPTFQEIKNGVLRGDDDLSLFLYAGHDLNAEITLVDEKNRKYTLSRGKPSAVFPFPYLETMWIWFMNVKFEDGDDIIFTCIDLRTHTFSVRKEDATKKDYFAIEIKNKILTDTVYGIINHTIPKHESLLFLFRKYMYIYPFNDPIPPDNLLKALDSDKRFLISSRDKMLSWSGHLIKNWLSIGLKKYYFKNDKNEWTPVYIDSDKKGRKSGSCSQCGERMYWCGDYVWEHPEYQGQYARKYLDPSFFTFDNGKRIVN